MIWYPKLSFCLAIVLQLFTLTASVTDTPVCDKYVVTEEGDLWAHEGGYGPYGGAKTCGNSRRIFQQTDTLSVKHYIYYRTDLRAWLLSDKLCSIFAVAKLHTNSYSPEGTWEVADTFIKDWIPEGLEIKCGSAKYMCSTWLLSVCVLISGVLRSTS